MTVFRTTTRPIMSMAVAAAPETLKARIFVLTFIAFFSLTLVECEV